MTDTTPSRYRTFAREAFENVGTISCKCGKHHRVEATVINCALGTFVETRKGGGAYAVLHGFDFPQDIGRRWHGASRVHVRQFATLDEAREALAAMSTVPCSGSCVGHAVATVNRSR